MQLLGNVEIVISLILLSLLLFLGVEGGGDPVVRNVSTLGSSQASPWLNKVSTNGFDPRDPGCWGRPWKCSRVGEFPPRMRCCRNRCIDVTNDVNNCGWCGIRCPFTWQCCDGFCVNINVSPFNCGKCGNRCPFGVPCFFGLCGYSQPFPPWPFPLPPRPPLPPFPFPPRPPQPPQPPRPPFPFPPRPPQPPFFPPQSPHPPFSPRPSKPPQPPHPPKGDHPPGSGESDFI